MIAIESTLRTFSVGPQTGSDPGRPAFGGRSEAFSRELEAAGANAVGSEDDNDKAEEPKADSPQLQAMGAPDAQSISVAADRQTADAEVWNQNGESPSGEASPEEAAAGGLESLSANKNSSGKFEELSDPFPPKTNTPQSALTATPPNRDQARIDPSAGEAERSKGDQQLDADLQVAKPRSQTGSEDALPIEAKAPPSATHGAANLSAEGGGINSPLLTAGHSPDPSATIAAATHTKAPLLASQIQLPEIPKILSHALDKVGDRPERIIVQLDPPELGRVSIDFIFDAKGLQHITITGETPEALRQLRLMHFELTQALERHGLTSTDMSFKQNEQQSRESDRGSVGNTTREAPEPGAPSVLLAPTQTARVRGYGEHGLDLRL